MGIERNIREEAEEEATRIIVAFLTTRIVGFTARDTPHVAKSRGVPV
jgi:hypothetical protein